MEYRIINGKLHFAQELQSVHNRKDNISFKDTLNSEINRNINLNADDMKNINSAINRAGNKGCMESALLYKNTVFITSIKNRTVIIALDKDSGNARVFTNIDSMVIV